MNTIFVRIPAYRDPDLAATLDGLFSEASHPERVFVGVCWQGEALERQWDQVRIEQHRAEDSRGPEWARHRADGLYAGEDLILCVDAHTRMAPGWDVGLVAELEAAGAQAVLSAPPAGFHPERGPSARRTGYRYPVEIDAHGLPSFGTRLLRVALERPLPCAFASPRFLFAPAAAFEALRADPGLYHAEAEICLSARLATHGWQVHAPAQGWAWHHYNDDGQQRPLHWAEQSGWRALRVAARSRARRLLGVEPMPPHRGARPDPHGLGPRPLVEFLDWCGLDLRRGMARRGAELCGFVRSVGADGHWLARVDSPPLERGPPLLVGDYLPYFRLPIAGGKQGEIHLYAGKPCLLVVLPRGAELETVGVTLKAARLRTVCVVEDAAAAAEVDLGRPPWLDPGGRVVRALGVQTATLYGLDASLRVCSVGHPDALAVRRAEAELVGDEEGRIISRQAPVLILDRILDPELRTALADYWGEADRFRGRTGSGTRTRLRRGAKIREDARLKGPLVEALDRALAGRLFPEVEKVFGLRVAHREAYKIGRYAAEEGGFFTQHRDNFNPLLAHRRFALSLALSEGYEGGGLCFPEYGPDAYVAPAGGAVVFPCSLMHRVDPVRAGRRLVVVTFLFGDDDARLRRSVFRNHGEGAPESWAFPDPQIGVLTHQEHTRNRHSFDPWKAAPPLTVDVVPSQIRPRGGLPPHVLVLENYLHPDTCARLLAFAEETAGAAQHLPIDPHAPEILSLFLDVWSRRVEPFYEVDLEWFERPRMRCEGPGDPDDDTDTRDRDYSVRLYLDGDGEGGALRFPGFDFELKPRAGMLVAFPADHRYAHSTGPLSSRRVVLLSWAAAVGGERSRSGPPPAATVLRE